MGREAVPGSGPVFRWNQADPGPSAPRRVASKKRLVIGVLLLVVLIAVAGSWAIHLVTRRPVLQVVPIPIASRGPGTVSANFENNLVLGVVQAADVQITPDGRKVPPLSEIRGLAVSWDGARIYAADPGTGVVTVFDRSGKALKVIGSEGKGKLRGPTTVAEAPDGRIFVVDRLENRLVVFDSNGVYLEAFRPANMPSNFAFVPISVAFSKDGAFYLGDGDGPVYVFDKERNLQRRLTPPGGVFQSAWGVSVNSAGQVAVTDSSNMRAFVFRADGTLQATLGSAGSGSSSLSLPRSIAIDERGRVFVSDTFSHRIQAYSADGAYLGYLGQEGNLDGQLNFPEGVAVDNEGALYVADRGNKRVQSWRY